MRAVSHDIELRRSIRLVGGQTVTALEIQRAYATAARAAVTADTDSETLELIDEWERVIEDLTLDPKRCADRLDWVAKLQLIEAYREREHLPWDAARLQLVDLQYADVRAAKGLAQLMMARGSMRRLFSDEEIERAVEQPPRETRAYFRGEVIRRYPENIAAASWDSVVFDLLDGAALKRVPLLDPLRGTAQLTEDLLDRSPTALALLDNLQQN
jgi:proteasome accessory factor A